MLTFPNAKINLGLNIIEKRTDGYHNLETIFYPIPLEDILEITTSPQSSRAYQLDITGTKIEGDPEKNLVIKALRILKQDFDIPPIRIHLHKIIPSGAGLGGGSANAAFMLKLLNTNFNLGLSTSQLEQYATKLGADCAFFINNKPTFAQGIGDLFTPIQLSLQGYQIYLVKPEVFVSTAMAYSSITPKQPTVPLTEIIQLPVKEWKNQMCNDFEKPIFLRFPELQALKESLYEAGATYAAMSGSGSTLFGLFKGKCPLKEDPHKHQYVLDLK